MTLVHMFQGCVSAQVVACLSDKWTWWLCLLDWYCFIWQGHKNGANQLQGLQTTSKAIEGGHLFVITCCFICIYPIYCEGYLNSNVVQCNYWIFGGHCLSTYFIPVIFDPTHCLLTSAISDQISCSQYTSEVLSLAFDWVDFKNQLPHHFWGVWYT